MSACNETSVCTPQTKQNECCAVEKSVQDTCCPVEGSVKMWNRAFFTAMKETQVDILKEKIRKSWGSMMEKEGDAIVKAMGAHWASLLAQANAQKDLRTTIQKLFESTG